MKDLNDAADMTPDERMEEVASLLATGILRLRRRSALPAASDLKILPESLPDGLEVPVETRLSVRAG
jgi:hypothetical protein